jgi:hypothetical protein
MTDTTYEICTDCYFYSHYGDDIFLDHITIDIGTVPPSWMPEHKQHQEHIQDIKQGFDKLGNVSIEVHHGEYCTQEYDSWCLCHETHFGWSPCDICDSRLGGDRHDVNIISVANEREEQK